jgi:hypothetical protein
MKRSIIFLCLILLLTPFVFCHDGHDHDNDGEDREIEVKTGDTEVEIESKPKDGGDKFKFRLRVNDEGGLAARVESESRDESAKSRADFRVFFNKLVQYTGGADYTGGANTVGSGYSLVGAEWNKFSCNNGSPKYVCTASTKDNVFAATFEFAGTTFVTSNLTVTPQDVKITVTINYPYVNASATDRVALFVYGKGKAFTTDPNSSSSTKTVNTGASIFSWITTATADGVDINVGTSAVTYSQDGDDKKFGMWFSFEANKPTQIVWDPTVSTDATASATALLINALVLLFALFML